MAPLGHEQPFDGEHRYAWDGSQLDLLGCAQQVKRARCGGWPSDRQP
jgi:hypothetical protein